MAKQSAVYILASKRNGTLYVGVTSNLVQRIWQHRNNEADSFTKKHSIHRLVYYEQTSSITAAIVREKNLKNWKRAWKLQLIEKANPNWDDLWFDII
ncbi:MAG: putative endonuclease [Pseudohongiellaceae bacterium]|jgi:putative endonuclease